MVLGPLLSSAVRVNVEVVLAKLAKGAVAAEMLTATSPPSYADSAPNTYWKQAMVNFLKQIHELPG